jgi:1,4-alpha-glucan branching enzyme
MAKTSSKKTKQAQVLGEAMKETSAAEKATSTPVPLVEVKFVLLDLGAKQVSVGGDFNDWSPTASHMQLGLGGHWETSLALTPGRHEYKFWVDGEWVPDPLAQQQVFNQFGSLNSVIEVRP